MQMLAHLPSLRALLGKLWKVDTGARVFLLVLLTAGLHKEGIGGGFSSGLIWVLCHGCNESRNNEGKNTKCDKGNKLSSVLVIRKI